MKFAFIGYQDCFDLFHIGGTDSIIRRISKELIQNGNKVYLINYGYENHSITEIQENLIQVRAKSFNQLISFLEENEIQEALAFYLRWPDRVYLGWRSFFNKKIKFHTLLTGYHDNFFKRFLLNLQTIFTFQNGSIYSVSARLNKSVKKLSSKAVLLFPPVEDDFFLDQIKRLEKPKIRIAYMGRLDYGKGADRAIDFFKKTNLSESEFEFFVYAYPWKSDPQSMVWHDELNQQNRITYIETKHKLYTPALDEFLKETIDNVDIFILPYRYLNSTIDTPLVPLEIMARNKIFLTTDLEEIKDIIPNTDLLIAPNEWNVENIEEKIRFCVDTLASRRKEILEFKQQLNYSTSSITQKLLSDLAG